MSQNSSSILVMKFGGTSVGSSNAMAGVVKIIQETRAQWPRTVIVTSALSGVTNLLLESAAQAARGETEQLPDAEQTLFANHQTIATALIADEARRAVVMDEIAGLVRSFVELCHAISVLGETTPRALDAVASLGERMSVRLLSAALQSAGTDSTYIEAGEIITTDDHFQAAHPDLELTNQQARRVLLPLLEAGQVPVVTGFLGATPEGVVTTLGRGGSDYTAGLLGAALPASEVWIWTDVDGVMTADPRLTPEAQVLPQISYSEIAELAYFGAKVLHPKAIRPVVEAGIGLRICNTFNPQHPGTWLVANGKKASDNVIRAVTAIRKQQLVTIEGRGMLGVPGVAARAFAAVAATDTSVPLITQASSEQSICFSIPSEARPAVLRSLEKTFAAELALRNIDRVWATEDVSIVTIVGYGIRNTPRIAGQVFTKLGEADINVLAIAHGSSDVSISLVVKAAETETAVRSLHELIVHC